VKDIARKLSGVCAVILGQDGVVRYNIENAVWHCNGADPLNRFADQQHLRVLFVASCCAVKCCG
jgi:hypothetical protein